MMENIVVDVAETHHLTYDRAAQMKMRQGLRRLEYEKQT